MRKGQGVGGCWKERGGMGRGVGDSWKVKGLGTFTVGKLREDVSK